MKTKKCLSLIVILLSVLLFSAAVQAVEWSYSATEHLSKIENIKIKFLKPEQIAENIIKLKWILPTDIEAKPDYFYLIICKKGIDKPYVKRYLSAKIDTIKYKLPVGEYKAYIKPLVYYPKKIYGRSNFINFNIGKYVVPIDPAQIEKLADEAFQRYEIWLKYSSHKKAQILVKKWLDSVSIVRETILNNSSIYIEFIDGKKLLLSLGKHSKDTCGFEDFSEYFEEDSEDEDNYYLINVDDLLNLEVISVYNFEELLPDYLYSFYLRPPSATTCPLSSKAIVMDSLHSMPEGDNPYGEYERAGKFGEAISSLRTIGYEVDVKLEDEVNLELLSQLDEGGYGVILYSGHGGNNWVRGEDGALKEEFIASVGPRYDTLEEAENSPYNDYIGTFILRTERKYWFILTKEFIDHYMDDILFPGSFIYWFVCASGKDLPKDNMYLSLFEKGVTTGWVGFHHSDAHIQRHAWATSAFFRVLEEDPDCTLAEAVVLGNEDAYPFDRLRESSLRLIDEEETGTNKLYIQIPDLTIEDVILDENNRVVPVIRNIGEGTVTYPRHLIHIRVRITGQGYIYDDYPEYVSLGPDEEFRPTLDVQIQEDCELRVYVDLHNMAESDETNNRLIKNMEVN